MSTYSLTHLSDAHLLRSLCSLVARNRAITAALLSHIAEVDARRLYAPAGYSSMHAYCVGELRLSEDEAYKRITAARAARQFPMAFQLVAEGRLHLTAMRFLAPHLTPENAEELLASAVGLKRPELEHMLARRFAVPAKGAGMLPLGPPSAPAQVIGGDEVAADSQQTVELVPGRVEAALSAPAASSQSARFPLKLAIEAKTQDKLRHAQALLSHSIPSGDIAQVFDRALDALISQLERRKFGRTSTPRGRKNAATPVRGRLVPAHIRRAVWARDQGQCTFVGDPGHRCGSRKFLEFDHVDPVARGGLPTMERMRLRCRTHNRLEAERVFGVEFMNGKRAGARRSSSASGVGVRDRGIARGDSKDVLAGLRNLGCRAREAARAIRDTESLHDAPLEERLRAALRTLRPRTVRGIPDFERRGAPV